MNTKTRGADEVPRTIEEEASDTFVQRLYGEWTAREQASLAARLSRDPAYADAYRRVEESWKSLDVHAEAPEVMNYREKALVCARRASARRWLGSNGYLQSRWRIAACAAALLLTLATAWQLSPYGYQSGLHRTGIGEQRLVDLDDRSRIALDAATRLQVRYTKDARTVRLLEGQAQFSVAHDPTRPFKVLAGDRTIVALGTVFTVEYVDQKVHVAMLEGRVSVIPKGASSPSSAEVASQAVPSNGGSAHRLRPESTSAIELAAGEELRVGRDGHTIRIAEADLEAATAWREGKVIFRTEPLRDAVRRLNRYSRLQIEIEGAVLAGREISGVFDAGDQHAFVSAVQRYLPVSIEYVDADTVRLRMQ